MRSLSLRIFLSFWLALLLIVVITVGITTLVVSQREQLPRSPRAFANEAAVALAKGGHQGLEQWMRTRGSRIPGVYVLLPDGNELLGRRVPHFLAPEPSLEDPFTLEGAPGVEYQPPQQLPTLVGPDGTPYQFLVLPHGNTRFGDLQELPIRSILFAVALLITGGMSYGLARSITRPINDLTSATQKLAAGDLAARSSAATRARGDELARLGMSFDTMAQRIDELMQARERLLRDVSHELRSPLARMRVALGLVRQPGADAERQIARLEQETERLNGLIGQILSVSRLGTAGVELEMEQVDVSSLIDTIARDAAYEAQETRKTVTWDPPAARVHIQGNAHWLGSAIENVVRNAIRHTPEGGRVMIGMKYGEKTLAIRIADEGPGVPEDELTQIFEPFYRSGGEAGTASARERHLDSSGEGLGLAITSRVLQAHGGSVRARNWAGGGLEVEMLLPISVSAGDGERPLSAGVWRAEET